jgi:hypothetical protein
MIETAIPVIAPKSGAIAKGAKVSITDATTGAAIYYTTNGATPTTSSKKYIGAFSVESPQTVKAIAVAAQHAASGVVVAKFTIR